jgi:hypothetical protein
VFDDVVPPLANQFQATNVLPLKFIESSLPKVNPSLSKEVNEPAN